MVGIFSVYGYLAAVTPIMNTILYEIYIDIYPFSLYTLK
jgi:hypothetical protein